MGNLDEEVLEERSQLEKFMDRSRGLEDVGRLLLVGGGAAFAYSAAFNQYLEGNPELGDFFGHMAAGMASALGVELGFHHSGLEDEFDSDVPKYAAMFSAGALGGAAIEVGQFYGEIPGNLDLESYCQTLAAGVYTAAFEMRKDWARNQDRRK